MKTSLRNRVFGSLFTGGLVLAAASLTPASSFAVTTSAEQPDVIAPLGAAPAVATIPPAISYSPGVSEILRMIDAKVDPQVIKAYIRNSPTAYNLTSSEIIALKEHGVPDDVLTTMMQRGGELRAQGVAPMAPAAPVPAPYVPTPAYDYDYGSAPYYADYGYPYYNYPYYPYDSWWASYGYPWPFYSPFFLGVDVFGHRFFHGHDFHHFNDGHFHNFRGNTFGRSGQPWAPVGRFGGRSFVSGGSGFRSFGGFSGQSGFAARGGFAGRSSGSFAMHGGGFHSGGGFRSGGGFGGHSGGHR